MIKDIEDISRELTDLTGLVKIISFSESGGMNYTDEEVIAVLRNIWRQLETISHDLSEHISPDD
jgi:hypothetical protein